MAPCSDPKTQPGSASKPLGLGAAEHGGTRPGSFTSVNAGEPPAHLRGGNPAVIVMADTLPPSPPASRAHPCPAPIEDGES